MPEDKKTESRFKKLPKSEIEMEGEIPADKIAGFRKEALKSFQKDAEMDGFRKGKVPEEIIVKKIGELAILEEAAELALQEEFPKIFSDINLDIIGRPKVSITKITEGAPVSYKIRASVVPEVKLPDYKKIAANEMKKPDEKIEVVEKEIDEVIEQLRKIHGRQHHTHAPGETHHEGEELKLPEVNDTFVKELGDFKDVADLRAKIKSNITEDKTEKAKEKKKGGILEKLVEKTEIDLPEILIESELNKMEARFKDDIERMGGKFEDYLKHIRKNLEDVRKEWRKDAEKRAKVQLIFNEIAKLEKIAPTDEEIKKEIDSIVKEYPEANPESAKVYVATILTNGKVFDFLESQK